MPGESGRKRAKDRYGGSKEEKGKERGRAMCVRKRGTERKKPQGKRIPANIPERVNDDKGRRGALTEDRGKG